MDVEFQTEKLYRKQLEDCLLSSELDLTRDKGTIFQIIPELKETDGFDHKHPHHCYDVWNHTRVALEKSKPDLQIRLALLLHDVGKPHSYQEGEVRHFHGHPIKSAQMTKEILTRIGYKEQEIQTICYLVENHDNLIDVSSVNMTNIEITKKLLSIQYCDAYAHAPQHVGKRISKLDSIYEQIKQLSQLEASVDNSNKGER